MKKIILAIAFAFHFAAVDAATPPAYTGKINNSIASILNSKLAKTSALGPSYDAQFQRTMAAMQGGLTASATTLVAGGLAASVGVVSWPALLIAAGVNGVVSGVVALGVDGLVNWLWPDPSHPGQVQLAGPAMMAQTPTYSAGLRSGALAWNLCGGYFGSPQEALSYCFSQTIAQYPGTVYSSLSFTYLSKTSVDATYIATIPSVVSNQRYTKNITGMVWNGIVCPPGSGWISGSTCTSAGLNAAGNPLSNASFNPDWQNVNDAIATLPESYKTVALSDQQLAAIVNAAWKAAGAAQADGSTFIFNPTSAVTDADVAAWRAANPGLAPSVGDFISPVAPTGTSTVPLTSAGTSNATGTGTPSPAKIDWGDFSEPNYTTPTVESILDPIFNLFPDWANFSFPQHQSQCPAPKFTVLHHVFTFDHMCDWIEMIRPAVQSAFALAWAVLVIFIVLGA